MKGKRLLGLRGEGVQEEGEEFFKYQKSFQENKKVAQKCAF